MSHIQGAPHPADTAEVLDYIRVDVDPQGALAKITVVTHHTLARLNLPQEATVYTLNPGPGQRDLATVLSATRRTALQGILAALAGATTLADTPTDPAPPLANPDVR